MANVKGERGLCPFAASSEKESGDPPAFTTTRKKDSPDLFTLRYALL